MTPPRPKPGDETTDVDPRDLQTLSINADYHSARTAVITSKYGDRIPSGASALRDAQSVSQLCASARLSAVPSLIASALAEARGADGEAKYCFEGFVGEGGMGQVVEVRDADIRRRVAMKLLLPEMSKDAELVGRFVDEVQIAGQLEHPNILPIYDMGTVGDEPFFTMKLVEGRNLRELLDDLRHGDEELAAELTLMKRLQLFQQVCHGMAYSHEKGVIHRDLKPENIMIGSFGEVLIMDWGLAMTVGSGEDVAPDQGRRRRVTTTSSGSFEQAGTINGTPAYMSPEQAKGQVKSLTPRSDVYSLGVILYELLVLEVPLRGRTTLETLLKVCSDEPEPPAARGEVWGLEIPEAFDEICLKALAKDPSARTATATQLAEEVQSYIDGSRERERRQREAADHVRRGRALAQEYREKRAEIQTLKDDIAALVAQVPAHAPLSEKRQRWALEERLEELEAERARCYEAAHDTFDAALGVDPKDAAARRAKAELFWDYYVMEEERGDEEAASHFRARVEAFDDGQYRERLDSAGPLRLAITPTPSRLHLSALEERDRLLTEGQGRSLPPGEVVADLEPGLYLLRAWRQGCAPLQIPIWMRRARETVVAASFLDEAARPEGFEVIPGGELILGGDAEAPSALPRRRCEVGGFLLGQRPVSAAEYLAFINELLGADSSQALSRLPRLRANTPPLWTVGAGGWVELAAQRFEGEPWDARWPIFGISYGDAVAYCQWFTRRRGVAVRLPTEEEWEWAARGPWSANFPWGSRFEANFCKMKRSRAGAPRPEPIGAYTADRSVFGVWDMAGGVHEWCRSEFDEERGMVALRGGSWMSEARRCRAAARIGDQPYDRHISYGFRLAMDWPA